jgi:hypothetical protein
VTVSSRGRKGFQLSVSRPPFYPNRSSLGRSEPDCTRKVGDGRDRVASMFPKTNSTTRFFRRVRFLPQAAMRRGLDGIIARQKPLALLAVVVEATGEFNNVVCGEPGGRGAAGHCRQFGASPRIAKALGQRRVRAFTRQSGAAIISTISRANMPRLCYSHQNLQCHQ